MKKEIRTGKVFVDWSQNDEHKTTVSVYSLRAREHPTVSTPVTWDEVESALKKRDASRLVFEAPDVLERFAKMGDLHEPVLRLKQKLPGLRKMAAAEAEEQGIDIAAAADESDHTQATAAVAKPAPSAKKKTRSPSKTAAAQPPKKSRKL